jgi:hypothetical protein
MLQELSGMTYELVDLSHKKDPEDYLEAIEGLMREMKNGNVIAAAQLK